MNTNSSRRDLAPALSRGVQILEILSDAGARPTTLSEIARALGAAKSSTSNLCVVLEDAGLIKRAGAGYVLGHRTLEFGGTYLRTFNELREFYRFCAESRTLSQEVVQIAMLDKRDVIYLARHEGQAPLRLTASIGERFPAAPTAVGNALLATRPPQEIEQLFNDPSAFPSRTENSVRNLEELKARLVLVRERGYASEDGSVHPGLSGIAVRVPPRSSSSPALAVGCTFITAMTSETRRSEIVDDLHALAQTLTNPLHPREQPEYEAGFLST
ncbi:MAG: IclR family transcriptional regulator [Cryobacterium sp.]|nr:IclR family transcriptional regulator [Cryobacterium sp.]